MEIDMNSLKRVPRLLAALALPATAHAAAGKTFTVLVSNVSTEQTLRLPDGTTSRVPVAPGAYAIVKNGAVVIQNGNAAGKALEQLAEDGNPDAFAAQLRKMKGVRAAGRFLHDEPFQVTVAPGERLVFAAMFAQSNDLFYAPDLRGIDLYDAAGKPRSGDLDDAITLYDAGTEVNEQPGAGPNQAPRQKTAGAGKVENGIVRPVGDGFSYPAATEVLQINVEPQ
jgi:hypothetical protein